MDHRARRQAIKYVFSDVDGTLVHEPKPTHGQQTAIERHQSEHILRLPPSSTGMGGIISARTLSLCRRLRRDHDVKLVLISGMRTSTLLERLPYLPRADAYASESGGRIFYPVDVDDDRPNGNDEGGSSSFRPVEFYGSTEEDLKQIVLEEDEDWRRLMAHEDSAGVDGYRGDVADAFLSSSSDDLVPAGGADLVLPLAERKSALWDFANSLVAKGFVIDCRCYASCFRVNRRQQQQQRQRRGDGGDGSISDEDFDALASLDVSGLGLGSSTNLGCIDFYPIRSGKKNCCAYLAKKFSSTQTDSATTSDNQQQQQLSGQDLLSQRAVCLCDDDNDLEMALACRTAYLPSVTSSSMKKAARDYPDRIIVVERVEANVTSTLATESALNRVLDEARSRA